jgi:AraC-like DNA-binding protein
MTLIFHQSDWDELSQQAVLPDADTFSLEVFEGLEGAPPEFARGYTRSVELLPELWLNFMDHEIQQDFRVRAPVHEHSIQLGIFLSGYLYFDAVHPGMGGDRGYFSGSGMSPAYEEKHQAGERLAIVDVEIEADWLDAFLQTEQYSDELRQLLLKGEDWKLSFYPTVTPAMQTIVQQLWSAPYRGAAKRMYLQAKVLELLAMHLDLISNNPPVSPSSLKPETIDRLHQARAILTRQLEHPPLLNDLAMQVGISDRTLRRGFRELFGTTVVGYLTQQRMQYAHQLLQSRQGTVAEVARRVGYGHLGHFAAAFKRQFGVTPKKCLMGKRLG